MTNTELIEKALADTPKMTTDEYYALSEDRRVVTPENLGDLLDYPALFHAMQDDRELRPALSEAMSTGRAMADFLGTTPEDFLQTYVIADGPVNPKTGKPYGTDTKAYVEWRATQEKTPVSTEQFNMFGKMASAYNDHAFIKTLEGHTRYRNAIIAANVGDVACCCKIDNLYVNGGSVFGIDVTTTSDLNAYGRGSSVHCRERLALIHLILAAVGVTVPQTRIAAIEKGPLPRCGIFAVKDQEVYVASVLRVLGDYRQNCTTGIFGTSFEAPALI